MRLPLTRKIKARIGDALSPIVPITKGKVAFVTKRRVPFGGNLRCVADEMLARGTHDVVIYSDGKISKDTKQTLEAKGARVLSGFSLFNLIHILSCEIIFVCHSIRDAHISVKKQGRTIINLWHGVPLKCIELLMPNLKKSAPQQYQLMKNNSKLYDKVISSNEHDIEIMSRAFGVGSEKVINSGLPRFDYMNDNYLMPADLLRQELEFQKEVRGRKVILYSPTFRETSDSPFKQMNKKIIQKLKKYAATHNCVFAIRPHPYDLKSAKHLFNESDDCFINAASNRYPETAIILRNTDILITDYSSIWVDFLLRDKPIVALTTDLDEYSKLERGFIHDLTQIFPGPIIDNWDNILELLNLEFNKSNDDFGKKFSIQRKEARKLFLPKYTDSNTKFTLALLKELQL